MSVHGRSILQYYNEDTTSWVPLPIGDVVSIEYVDKVYAPAHVEIIISNRNMNRPLGTDVDATAGTYSVEGTAVTTPTFRRFQEIRLLHMPRPLIPIVVVHDSHGTQATFTKMAHTLTSGDYIQLATEQSGAIEDDLYKVDTVADANTFTLDKKGIGSASQTYSTSLPGGGPTATAINNGGGYSDSATSLTVDSTTGISDGDHIKIGTEILRVTTVASSTVLNPVVREMHGTSAASMADNAVVTKVDTAFIQYRSDQALHPYFYGKIDTIDVSYSDVVGKTIHIEASDYLRSLATEPITKSIQNSTSVTQGFGITRLIQGDVDTAADQGKFRDTKYDNVKLSTTVGKIMDDWSVGKQLYHDNTYDGSTSTGVGKFEDSSHTYPSTAYEKTKSFKDKKTSALAAMRTVAMTDIHSNDGYNSLAAGGDVVDIKYGTDGALVTSGTADVLIFKAAHGYKDGNLVGCYSHAIDGSPDPTDIETGIYVVHTATTNYFKIKTLDGTTVQSVSNGGDSEIDIEPTPTGDQGYDFYLDAGLYGDITLSSNTHRPHLNYFMRGSKPVEPASTGLSAVYPSAENMVDDETAFGTKEYNQTKVFMLDDFDQGLFEEDLYTQVALTAVDKDGTPKDSNALGHKMEMFKVNSMSNSDAVAMLGSAHYVWSGSKNGNAVFHWNRGDDARRYGWYGAASTIDSALKVNIINANFFASSADLSAGAAALAAEQDEDDYASQGTYGVIDDGHGGFRRDEVTGMAGYSALPSKGRSITQSSGDSTAGKATNAEDNFHDVDGVSRAIGYGTKTYHLDFGGESIAPANLIKDIYWCEQEGLLGTEVTAAHNGSDVAITVTETNHGLETGCLIKVTNISGTTTGAHTGVVVGDSPEAPTTANTTNSATRDTGGYYRVYRIDANTFFLSKPQQHKTHYVSTSSVNTNLTAFSGSITGSILKYKPVFNVFKDACRVQWQSGSSWTTKENDTVVRSATTKGAQHILISDVAKNDRPYRGIEVNTLVAGRYMPGADSSAHHPLDYYIGGIEGYSYFGYSTVAFSLEEDFQDTGSNVTTANVHRYGSDSDDDVRVQFKYGDYISETRFLYGDPAITGVVGRDKGDADGGGLKSSKDVFKTVKCKVLERFSNHRSISKTYNLNYNESFESPNSARNAAATILKRVVLPAQRTTFRVFGYPAVKLIGQGQSSSTGSSLDPAQDMVSYGGGAGMLLEKLDAADGAVTDSTLVSAIHPTTDVITAPILGDWDVGTYYRAFIYSRAGMSIRVVHPAAGVTGDHIITGLKYNERAGSTITMISTTGYDEAVINLMHTNLARLKQTISGTSAQGTITVTSSAFFGITINNIENPEMELFRIGA